MDIRVSDDEATAAERTAVDRVYSVTHRSSHTSIGGVASMLERRPLLLDGLWALQEASGAITRGGLNYLCIRLGVPPAEAYGVASAYSLFSFDEPVETVTHVCDDIACRASQGHDPAGGWQPTAQARTVWHRSPCLGHCEFGTAAMVQTSGEHASRHTVAPCINENMLTCAADGGRGPALSHQPLSELRLLRRIGRIDPDSLQAYTGVGGWRALRAAVSMGPERVVEEIRTAKLLGRGGAAFPTASKWDAVRSNTVHPHYLVCNADESEPGTFKDRILMEDDPFAIVEAMTIAGFATGSQRGYLYVRGEYPEAEARMRNAIRTAGEAGFLGPNVIGSGFQFDIEVRRGAGAYIAGEETALFNSIEGKRPEPRNKPPFPTQSGLFGKPTAANNVETLVNALDIMTDGGEAYGRVGTEQSTGTRLFCVSGRVTRPGLYELPMGARLLDLLALAGSPESGEIRAVLLGGAAGVFVSPHDLDIELSFEGARAAGVTLGSGVVIVFGMETDFSSVVRRIAAFFRDESCGQCVPCRVGTVRQEEMLTRLMEGSPIESLQPELATYRELSLAMKDASICGLGQTATSAIESALRLGLVPNVAVGP
jgi:NADH-quinone oxidoreductase subunit F